MKRVTYLSRIVSVFIILLTYILPVKAQMNESPISIGADLVSRYVWRGTDYGKSPSIQPYMEAGIGDFAIGVWGAYSTNQWEPQEMDIYFNYTFNDMVTIGFFDYFFPAEFSGYDYFDYANDSSGHIFEAYATFNGLENIPVSALFGVNLYGDSNNSLYVELGYSFSILDLFVGMGNGFYTVEDPGKPDKFGVVNVGISASKEVPVTDKYAIPISASLITNPNAKAVYLVFGISF